MISFLVAGSATEPVSLAQAKAFLRLDGDGEDGLVGTLIAAARLHVEGITGKALTEQSWRLVLDSWPVGGSIRLPVGPVRAITAVNAWDGAGVAHAITVAQFDWVGNQVLLPATIAGQSALRAQAAIEIDWQAGYEEVPADLMHAVLSLVAHWFEHRDAVIVAGTGAVVPAGFDRLVAGRKAVRL